MSLKNKTQILLRITDKMLGKILDPLANKCGGAVNLTIMAMIVVIIAFSMLLVCWGNTDGAIISIIILSIMLIAAKIFTRDKIRVRSPWWYRRK